MKRVIIIGANNDGRELLELLSTLNGFEIVAIVDKNEHAVGMKLARKFNIEIDTDWRTYIDHHVDFIIETTGNKEITEQLMLEKKRNATIIPKETALLIRDVVNVRKAIFGSLEKKEHCQQLIFDSIHDGMLVIDIEEKVILFNKKAELITGVVREGILGKKVSAVFPSSRLAKILTSREIEVNQEQVLDNGKKVISSRIPLIDKSGNLLGALEVFKEIKDVVQLAGDVTNLNVNQMILKAIMESSAEGISVVNEAGEVFLINNVFKKLANLSNKNVIGKPLTDEIFDGENVHKKVLQTRRPVRDVRKIGQDQKEVLVNVTPVIVDGKLKGSVGVFRDISLQQNCENKLNRARQIIRSLEAKYSFADIIGESEEMKLAIDQAKFAAKTPVTILLRGEKGTEKDRFAYAIHNESVRKYNKFIRINCAAFDEKSLERELFGYEEDRLNSLETTENKGVFELANNGTVFLDDVGGLSPGMQLKLLKFIQNNTIVKVGGDIPIQVNVRIIAATNLNIEKAMAEGEFREDLYYKLARYPISIPPLRERKEDLPALCHWFIKLINQESGRRIHCISNKVIEFLMSYNWPGNIRELENILSRIVLFMEPQETTIYDKHLNVIQGLINSNPPRELESVEKENETLAEAIERVEAEVIKKSLILHEYNRTKTAKALGISLRNLYYKMEKYQLANNSMD